MNKQQLLFILAGLALFAAVICAPFGDVLSEASDGFSDTLTIISDGLENLTDITVDGIEAVQSEINDFAHEQLEYRIEDVVDFKEAVADVAEDTVGGLRDTANAAEGWYDDSLKDTGRFADAVAQSNIDGAVDAAEATGDAARNIADTIVRVWTDTGDAFGALAHNIVDNSVNLARDTGDVWKDVAKSAVKAFTKFNPYKITERYMRRSFS